MSADLSDGGLGYLLVQAAQAWRGEVSTRLVDLEVTPSQFFVLVTLLRRANRGKPPVTQRDVADRTRMDANTTSQIVRGLQQRGLLTRQPHPSDSRAVVLGLTDHGVQLARDCARRVREVSDGFFAGIGQSQLQDTLSTLIDRAGSR